jgi:glutamyl-Q tRNA(Asp) synthetase
VAAGAGRFAPSPTGPLHLGSLLAATASFLDARRCGVDWRVRMDDLDTPRNQPGAEAAILRSLEAHGLCWDGPITRQSENLDAYESALRELQAQGLLFFCDCTRSSLHGHLVYPGSCRRFRQFRHGCAIRVEVNDAVVEFDDLIRGHRRENLATSVGDFVVKRRDGIIAYQLATAVDDGAPDIGRVIRGNDLLMNTGRQLFLMDRLELQRPVYGHVPVLVNEHGQKLSKQTYATPLSAVSAAANLTRVLGWLGLGGVAHGQTHDCETLLQHAVPLWSPERLHSVEAIEIS